MSKRPFVQSTGAQRRAVNREINALQQERATLRRAVRELRNDPFEDMSVAGLIESQTAGGRRRSQGNKKKQGRWGFSLGELSAGPLRIGNVYAGSGEPKQSQSGKKRSMVGLASHTNDIQVLLPEMRREWKGVKPIDVWSGTEYLTAIGSADTTGNLTGDIMFSFPINPSNFDRTRLGQITPLYQRYRFRKLIFHYQPVAPATESGQLIGFGDYDVDNDLEVDTPDNVNVAAAHLGQEITKVWEFQDFPFGVVDEYTNLFTALTGITDNRLVYQGNYYLIAASDLEPGKPLGNIYVSYEIEFSIPQLYAAAASPGPSFQIWDKFETSLTSMNIFGSGESAHLFDVFGLGGATRSFTDGVLAYTNVPNGRYALMLTYTATGTSSTATQLVIAPTIVSGDPYGDAESHGFASNESTDTVTTTAYWEQLVDVTEGELALSCGVTITGTLSQSSPHTVLFATRLSPLFEGGLPAKRPKITRAVKRPPKLVWKSKQHPSSKQSTPSPKGCPEGNAVTCDVSGGPVAGRVSLDPESGDVRIKPVVVAPKASKMTRQDVIGSRPVSGFLRSPVLYSEDDCDLPA